MQRIMRRHLIAGVVTVVGLAGTAVPALAQARGSAEASAAAVVKPKWAPPKLAWGHPDLEGIWTSDDMRGVPMSRPTQFGNRKHLTDEEFTQRARERSNARDVNDARTGTFRNEEGSRDFGYTSLVIDPPDGRVPALTPEAKARRPVPGTNGVGPFDTVEDFNNYDRCITRGLAGSWLPVVYGNGARIIQTPESVIIAYEMVHDTRIIPLDGRPHIGTGIQQLMGDSRGRWEGNTLVVETTNFTDRTSIGPNGGGARHSTTMKMTERITRIDPEMIDYELRIEDTKTYVAPWTIRMTLTTQPGYEIYEYGCHEGNGAVKNSLSAERAYEKQAAENAAKGLPPPERVFERVNGADRGR
jgi:hypothetical protein